jgi:hypothetical protein
MTREERIKLAIEKGITCNPITGEVKGVRGKVITRKSNGYIDINFIYNKKEYHLLAHQFVWYDVHKQIVDCIDHINGKRHDNRIENLRSVTQQQNLFNTNAKGYYWNKRNKKWNAKIKVNGKSKHIGLYDTEQEAHQAYLNEKKILHI